MAKGRKTGGRRQGTPNKTTVSVKEALMQTFVQRGGPEGLLDWSKENPTEFYKLWGRLLPQEIKNEVTGRDGGPIKHQVWVVNGKEIVF
jgi:hypothetical protein